VSEVNENEATEATGMSPARKARKEAQTLVDALRFQLDELAALLRGRSGLTADDKAAVLAEAKNKATEVENAAKEVSSVVSTAHNAATS
jgi:superfamily II helicase